MQICLLRVSAIQSKQKSVLLHRSESILPSHPLFVYIFLVVCPHQFSLEQHDKPVHKLLHCSCPFGKTKPTTEHSCDLNSSANITLSLIFLLLALVLFHILAEFWFRKMYSNLLHMEHKETFVFSHAEVFSALLHLQTLQKMAGHRKREVPLISLQLALLPARQLK